MSTQYGHDLQALRRIVRVMSRWVAIAGIGLIAAADAPAVTWYVATNGNDTTHNGTGGWHQAYATISNAVTKAVSGDAVWVSNGVYTLTAQIDISKGVTVRSWNNGNIDQTNTIINGNAATRCVWLNSATAVIDGFTLTNGSITGSYGGGIFNGRGTVRNCRIVNNTASGFGSGIYLQGSSSRLEWSVIQANSTADNSGGAVYMNEGGSVSHCSIISNVSSGGNSGGGIYMMWTGQVENCTINGNSGKAGGIWLGYDGTVTDCTIINNVGGWAGGVYIRNGASVSGGLLVERCMISSNMTPTATCVGGLYFRGGASSNGAIVRNCLISYNSATNAGRAGGVLWDDSHTNSLKCRLENCTVIYNQGGYSGGAFLFCGGQIINSLIYYNSGVSKANVYVHPVGGTGRVDYSCSYPSADMGALGQNNITNAPLMVDTNTGNYRLAKGSPCINAGSNMNWTATATDLDGRPRLDFFCRQVDMGAYEFLPAGTMIMSH